MLSVLYFLALLACVASLILFATVGLLSLVTVSAMAVTPEKALITKELHKPMVAKRCQLILFMSSLLSMYHFDSCYSLSLCIGLCTAFNFLHSIKKR